MLTFSNMLLQYVFLSWLSMLARVASRPWKAANDALQLEHLENTFYKGAISTMPESEFLAAGFSSAYYNNLKYIAHDEEQHVMLLTSALAAAGAMPVAACSYKFPYTDPKSFVTLASILEG